MRQQWTAFRCWFSSWLLRFHQKITVSFFRETIACWAHKYKCPFLNFFHLISFEFWREIWFGIELNDKIMIGLLMLTNWLNLAPHPTMNQKWEFHSKFFWEKSLSGYYFFSSLVRASQISQSQYRFRCNRASRSVSLTDTRFWMAGKNLNSGILLGFLRNAVFSGCSTHFRTPFMSRPCCWFNLAQAFFRNQKRFNLRQIRKSSKFHENVFWLENIWILCI